MPPDVLSGPVDVCVGVPRLELDRAFTYLLAEDDGAGTGSMVSVPFHGRTVKGWILGPASEVPAGRLLAIRKVRSPVRFFDRPLLDLFRWMSERYIAPLSTVIERTHPPRVASEERAGSEEMSGEMAPHGEPLREATEAGGAQVRAATGVLARYGAEGALEPGSLGWLRPLPGEEALTCEAAVEACAGRGRGAIVIVPEAEPLPATARAVLRRFGPRAVLFAGGDERSRYRTWLDIQTGRFPVVVGTRPAVFAPLKDLGLVWISREVHPGHREERAPYYHVRDVAAARARIEGAACIVASLSPSVETAVAVAAARIVAFRAPRRDERAAAPLVETVPPEAEDRSGRLAALLKRARSAALIVSRRGFGIARVCRTCGEPAACAVCRGAIVVERAGPRCAVCGAPGACSNCGGRAFGAERGGTERIAEWAARIGGRPVDLESPGSPPPGPARGRVLVGTAAAVKDVGAVRADLVAILDPDRALARAGVHAGEQALATWMEAAAWAGPKGGPGRVLVQTRQPGHPAVQALVRWDPEGFLLTEAAHRRAAGLAPGHPTFRVVGTGEVEAALRAAGAETVLATAGPEGTVCLVAVQPESLPGLRSDILRLAEKGVVSRVEAEPTI